MLLCGSFFFSMDIGGHVCMLVFVHVRVHMCTLEREMEKLDLLLCFVMYFAGYF